MDLSSVGSESEVPSLRILWLEDNATYRRAMIGRLRHYARMTFLEASTLDEALALLDKSLLEDSIDRLLIDVCLGEYGNSDGMRFLEIARACGVNVPAFVLTGALSTGLGVRIKQLGAIDLVKDGSMQAVDEIAAALITGGVASLVTHHPGVARSRSPYDRIAAELSEPQGAFVRNIDAIERAAIRLAIANEETTTQAAKSLGMERQTLAAKLRKLGLSPRAARVEPRRSTSRASK